MSSEIVSLRSFSTRGEAEFIKQLLLSEGIESRLSGDDASGWAPHIGFGTGGIALLVRQEDLEQASALLTAQSDSASESGEPAE